MQQNNQLRNFKLKEYIEQYQPLTPLDEISISKGLKPYIASTNTPLSDDFKIAIEMSIRNLEKKFIPMEFDKSEYSHPAHESKFDARNYVKFCILIDTASLRVGSMLDNQEQTYSYNMLTALQSLPVWAIAKALKQWKEEEQWLPSPSQIKQKTQEVLKDNLAQLNKLKQIYREQFEMKIYDESFEEVLSKNWHDYRKRFSDQQKRYIAAEKEKIRKLKSKNNA